MKWKIMYNMTKNTIHFKNKKHSRIFRKFQIYTGYASMKWKILYNMTKNTKHLKNIKKIQKTFQNIPQIPDIYRLCLHEMENSVQHDKKYKTFKKH